MSAPAVPPPPRQARRKGLRIGKALRIASKTARLPARIVTTGITARRSSLAPTSGEQPAAILRVQILGCNDLLGKDRAGTSDPFVTVTFGKQRYQTPWVKRNVNPVYDAKTATFDFRLYLSLADRLGPLEFVIWDKDIMKREYLGEASLKAADWFPEGDTRRAIGFDDPKNAPKTLGLLSSRRRSQATGSLTVKVGLIPSSPSKQQPDFDTIYSQLLQQSNYAPSILSAPPTESIGTYLAQEENEEFGDDGLSSDDDTDIEELDERDLSTRDFTARDFASEASLPSSPRAAEPPTPTPQTPSLLKPPPSSYFPAPAPPSPTLPRSHRRASSADSTAGKHTVSLPPSRSRSPEPGATTPGGKPRRPRFGRAWGQKNSTYNFSAQDDILGIVMLEVQSADDLPKIKNATGLGWDMDPFTVISFGKKVFRTRVIRHSLAPKWEEKLLFHVRRYESTFQIQFTLLDWDKITANDLVGDASIDIGQLMESVPERDPETGLYPPESIGVHHMKEFKLPLKIPKDASWEGKFTPTLTVRAKYQPYDALRQRFWRQYLKQYDADDTGTFSRIELTSMLDSLGSTLTKETIDSMFSMHGKSVAEDEEITLDQAIMSLEALLNRPNEEKRRLPKSESLPALGTATPATPATTMPTPAFELEGLDFSGYSATPADNPQAVANAVEASRPNNPYTLSNEPNQQPVENLMGPSSMSSSTIMLSLLDADDGSPPRGGDVSPPFDGPTASRNNSPPRAMDGLERVINIKTCPLCHRPRLNSRAEVDIVTHLAVCASSDWGRVDRMIVGNFVTASQAQRKWLMKAFSSLSTGSYKLGANSANIIVQNRLTGQLEEEKMQVYVRLGIRILYRVTRNQMEGARARRLLKSMSIKQGQKYDSPSSVRDIQPFIAFHNLNINEIREPINSFKTFNQFFYRKLKADARPVSEPDNPSRLVSPADCRMMAFETVSQSTKIWIKGRGFTVQKLLGEAYRDQAAKYEGGALGIFRLAPQDYHRFHSPVDGVIGPMKYYTGEYYTVNPQAIRTALDVYGENCRKIVPIDSPSFGRVMAVCIGAMMVGSIVTTVKEGEQVARGQEFGYFAFGGSTIVLLFEKDVVEWDEDLLVNGRASLETLVRMGSGIGHSLKKVAA